MNIQGPFVYDRLWLWSGSFWSTTVAFLLLQHFNYFLLSSPRRYFISYSFDFYVLEAVVLMS